MKQRSMTGVLGLGAMFVFGMAYVAADGRPQNAGAPAPVAAAAPSSAAPQRALLDRYCFSCHNERLKTGGVALDGLDIANVGENSAVWERAVRKLHARAMPPAGPRPR